MGHLSRLSVAVALLLVAAAGCATEVPPPSPSPTDAPASPASPVPATPPAEPSPTEPTASPAGSTAPPTAPATPAIGFDWQLLEPGDEFSEFDVISGTTLLGSNLIAVGSHDDGLGRGRPAAWLSADGLRWQRADVAPAAGAPVMEAVANGPAGLVSVGYRGIGQQLAPIVWISRDGLDWELIQDVDLERGLMTAVAASRAGYLALGVDPDSGEALAWLSADGRDWLPAMAAPAFGLEPALNGVISLADRFIAYGQAAGGEQAALWSSVDGRNWQSAPAFPAGPDSSVNALARSAGRTVAVGASYLDTGTLALAWYSDDGLTWQPSLDQSAGQPGEMLAVAALGSSFMAVGDEGGAEREDFRAALWWSEDGSSWQRLPTDASFELGRMSALLPAGPGVVALGERALDPSVEVFRPQVWIGAPR